MRFIGEHDTGYYRVLLYHHPTRVPPYVAIYRRNRTTVSQQALTRDQVIDEYPELGEVLQEVGDERNYEGGSG